MQRGGQKLPRCRRRQIFPRISVRPADRPLDEGREPRDLISAFPVQRGASKGSTMAGTHLSIRIDLASGGRIGPGKIALLEAIRSTGSISAAARSIGMSYRRAWLLVDEINQALRQPAVTAETGGVRGGGAAVTPVGERVVGLYRAIEFASTRRCRQRVPRHRPTDPPQPQSRRVEHDPEKWKPVFGKDHAPMQNFGP